MPSRVSTGGPWLLPDNHISQNSLPLITWRLRNPDFYSDLARTIQQATGGTVLNKIAEDISVYPIMFLLPPRLRSASWANCWSDCSTSSSDGSVSAPIVSRVSQPCMCVRLDGDILNRKLLTPQPSHDGLRYFYPLLIGQCDGHRERFPWSHGQIAGETSGGTQEIQDCALALK